MVSDDKVLSETSMQVIKLALCGGAHIIITNLVLED